MAGDYSYINVTDEGKKAIEVLREHFAELAGKVDFLCPAQSRAKSLAHTNLQQASLWAVRAMAEANEVQNTQDDSGDSNES